MGEMRRMGEMREKIYLNLPHLPHLPHLGDLNLAGKARKHALAPLGKGEYKEQLLLLGFAG
jgi:hypothetical protein